MISVNFNNGENIITAVGEVSSSLGSPYQYSWATSTVQVLSADGHCFQFEVDVVGSGFQAGLFYLPEIDPLNNLYLHHAFQFYLDGATAKFITSNAGADFSSEFTYDADDVFKIVRTGTVLAGLTMKFYQNESLIWSIAVNPTVFQNLGVTDLSEVYPAFMSGQDSGTGVPGIHVAEICSGADVPGLKEYCNSIDAQLQ